MNTDTRKQTITLTLDQLHVSPLNMRYEKNAPSLKRMAEIAAYILPSIREKGILTNPIVRPNNSGYEIIAGSRRFYGAKVVENERGSFPPITCDLIPKGDDALALELSLIENVAREDADEITEYQTYQGLIRLGRSPAEIAKVFGKTEQNVMQRLALANLHPGILDFYREDEEFSPDDLQALTLASKKMQLAYLALAKKNDAPSGRYLRKWLLGGDEIATTSALFDLATYKAEIRKDLFGDRSFFADSADFWKEQNKAIAALRDGYLASGWSEVIVMEKGKSFPSYDLAKAKKADGARVIIEVKDTGEVIKHEGYVTQAEKRRLEAKDKKGAKGAEKEKAKPANPITATMGNYLALHRHSLVRLALIANPANALKLMVAHAVSSSGNWRVGADFQKADNDAIKASIAKSPAQAAFEAERKAVDKLLAPALKKSGRRGWDDAEQTVTVFRHLLTLKDKDVTRIAAFIMAETLSAGGNGEHDMVDELGVTLKVNPLDHYKPDPLFFDLLRDRAMVNRMLVEVAGKQKAAETVSGRLKDQKAALAKAAASKPEWCPGPMRFPATVK
jgi:ParB family chromosome partitioning protein